jgi:hypothetical protein
LIGLEALQGVHRIVSPLAIYLAFEITALGKRLLDLLIALGIGMKLVARARSCAPGRASGNFVASGAGFGR